MSPTLIALIVPAAPALAAVLLAAAGRRMGERGSWVAIGALALSCAASAWLLLSAVREALAHPGAEVEPIVHSTFRWLTVGGAGIDFGLLVDGLAASVLLMVAVVAIMVFTYATGYMHGDERYSWFFAVFLLFTACMLGLVTSSNLLQLMVFWEVMGLCSFLLIGYWYERPEARMASFKAFMTTRVGDMGFLLAVALLFVRFRTLDIPALMRLVTEPGAHGFVWIIAALLFTGAVGKSAQFPLYIWLPDAMAGPTPVSGLLHSATMVAAGVFLVARVFPLFEAASFLPWIAAAGIFSAMYGAALALTETDIKRMLAYSTMSQLGFMMAALGSGGYVAAVFHLITHGFFKSLLFLSAGSVIHGAETQDIREMGGLGRKMRVTAGSFLVGALALSGIPPLAGFFSKDAVLASLWGVTHSNPFPGWVFFVAALMTAVLSAYYMFRVYLQVFAGPRRGKAHEPSRRMLAPMVGLAVCTVLAGLVNLPGAGLSLAGLIEPLKAEPVLPLLMLVSTIAAGAGVYVAWEQARLRAALHGGKNRPLNLEFVYGGIFLTPVFAVSRFLRELQMDALVDYIVVRPTLWLCELASRIDPDVVYTAVFVKGTVWAASTLATIDAKVIDSTVDAIGHAGLRAAAGTGLVDTRGIDAAVDDVGRGTVALGDGLKRLQTGVVANYALFMLVLGIVIFYIAWVIAK